MLEWRFIPLEIRDGYWNMAIDEAIFRFVMKNKSPPTLRFYKWKPSTVSIGRNQSLSAEVDVNVAKQKGFNIVRRITGGGAVFHDEFREITYSISCPISYLKSLNAHTVLEQFELIEMGIIHSLMNYNLKPEKGIIHCPALFINGKKFSGNAQKREKGYVLQHGTILLDLDPELMYSVLKAPNNVSKTRMVKSVYAKCIGIKEKLNDWDEKKFLIALKKGFEKALRIKLNEGKLSEEEQDLAKKLVEEKYKNKDWLKKYE